ncbi:hypothetical protein [Spiroplasma endosymbiont of Stenodema calcarata]|uniref:hypothetical protein n=1 Tax=Spiroplasma endosymbiont of Stenodema calcarata TaxID=3139328 RepID=UPI003CCAA0E7
MYQQLNKTDKLSNYDDKYILFNFRFTLIETKLDTSDYKNIFNRIITHYSKITVREFDSSVNIEYNKKIINRQKEKNTQFIDYIKNNYDLDLKRTFDIYRGGNGKRADGLLIKNIFYLLEITNHNQRDGKK